MLWTGCVLSAYRACSAALPWLLTADIIPLTLNSLLHYLLACIKVVVALKLPCLLCAHFLFEAVCMPPNQQPNGKWTPVKPNYQIDDTVWLECLTGYKLADQRLLSVTCGKDTLWSIPGPTCLGKRRVFFLWETMLCEFQEIDESDG